ncbi:serine/threonine protein kinase, partial [Myxococcota bacterium]|nr:serine/threonine protein kinase [Myxococcota bacterium]
ALVHAHSKNIIHRDLKPENIFLSDDGRVVLADFGIAKAFEQAGASDATIQYGKTRLYGSPSYIAPEQLAGAAASPQSDLFALGALLYELLTGEPPFTGGDLAAILKAVAQAKFGGFDAAIPVGTSFQELIQSLVQKDPALRPASTQDVANKLRHILDLEEISDPRLFLAKTDQATRDLQKIERQKEGAVEEATEIFKTSTPSGLHIKKKPINELITRIPFFFAFAGIALALGAGFYVLPKLRVTAAKESASLDAQGLSEEENKKRALVLFRFEGQAELRIDEKLIGRFEERVRLSMFGGEHRVQLEGAKIHIDQKVRIIAESQPEFDFRP